MRPRWSSRFAKPRALQGVAFDSPALRHGTVAQLVERAVEAREVRRFDAGWSHHLRCGAFSADDARAVCRFASDDRERGAPP
jgi:hypothetical protein